MLEKLRNFNPELKIYDVNSLEFKEYGRVLENLEISEPL